jgi:hypothetical protein
MAIITVTPATSFTANSAPASSRTTFEPVTDAIISQIMGYVSLGIGELGIDRATVPAYVYRWHTWLKRMNDWMRKNRKIYPRMLQMPSIVVPANLYFLESFASQEEKTANVEIAPLGPLPPIEFNTFAHALRKGVDRCSEGGVDDKLQFLRLLRDVNKLATFAIEVNNRLVPRQSAGLKPLILENFSNANGNGGKGILSSIPLWMWVMVLMLILFLLVKPNGIAGLGSAGNRIEYAMVAPSAAATSAFQGGKAHHSLNKIISISDFNVPNVI